MKYLIMVLGITTLLISGFSNAQNRLIVASCEDFKQKVEEQTNVLLRKKQKANFNNLSLSVNPKQTEIISYVFVVGFDMSAKRAGLAANNLCHKYGLVDQLK